MDTAAVLREHLAEFVLLDHHCHAPRRLRQRLQPEHLRRPFTESSDPAMLEHVPHTVVYRLLLRWLSALLGTDPTEQAVLEARAQYDEAAYHRLLADDARLGPCYDDYLFDTERCYSPSEWAALLGRPVVPVIRIETVAEQLLPEAESWADFRRRFSQELAARGIEAAGFKSIAAYRGGLAIEPVDLATAEQAFREVRAELDALRVSSGEAEWSARPVFRLTHRPFIDALLWEALEVAAELSRPVQFHVGLGDDDVVLPQSDPTLLRPIFREARYRHVPIVLLHCYPFVRQAAYLASIYPNVYVDLGLTLPLAAGEGAHLVRTALGLAPASKLLASTDGHELPEFQWLAARLWREALAQALGGLVDDGLLTLADALEVAGMVLAANAQRIYPPLP